MKLKLKTPQGEMQLTVSQGFVGTAEVAPDGGVVFSMFPQEEPPPEEQEADTFIGE